MEIKLSNSMSLLEILAAFKKQNYVIKHRFFMRRYDILNADDLRYIRINSQHDVVIGLITGYCQEVEEIRPKYFNQGLLVPYSK
jgi:hypothetical protein